MRTSRNWVRLSGGEEKGEEKNRAREMGLVACAASWQRAEAVPLTTPFADSGSVVLGHVAEGDSSPNLALGVVVAGASSSQHHHHAEWDVRFRSRVFCGSVVFRGCLCRGLADTVRAKQKQMRLTLVVAASGPRRVAQELARQPRAVIASKRLFDGCRNGPARQEQSGRPLRDSKEESARDYDGEKAREDTATMVLSL